MSLTFKFRIHSAYQRWGVFFGRFVGGREVNMNAGPFQLVIQYEDALLDRGTTPE